MRRFNYDDNNDENRREVDDFFREYDPEGEDIVPEGISPQDYSILKEDSYMFELEFDIAQQEMTLKLLRAAVKIAESSFWWKFYSLDTRLNMIDKIYKKIKKIEDNDAKV